MAARLSDWAGRAAGSSAVFKGVLLATMLLGLYVACVPLAGALGLAGREQMLPGWALRGPLSAEGYAWGGPLLVIVGLTALMMATIAALMGLKACLGMGARASERKAAQSEARALVEMEARELESAASRGRSGKRGSARRL